MQWGSGVGVSLVIQDWLVSGVEAVFWPSNMSAKSNFIFKIQFFFILVYTLHVYITYYIQYHEYGISERSGGGGLLLLYSGGKLILQVT